MITLYDCATAPSPRRARIFLAEKGVPHDTVQVNLREREQLGVFEDLGRGDLAGDDSAEEATHGLTVYGPGRQAQRAAMIAMRGMACRCVAMRRSSSPGMSATSLVT